MTANPRQMAAKMALLLRKALTLDKFIEVVFETPLDMDTLEVIDMVLDCVCMTAFDRSYTELEDSELAVVHDAVVYFRKNGRLAYEEVFVVSDVGEA